MADDARRYAERALGVRNSAPIGPLIEVQPYRTLGLLTKGQAGKIAKMTAADAAPLEMYDWALDASTVRKVFKDHGIDAAEALQGQTAVTAEDYRLLPRIIEEADRLVYGGTSDVGRPVVRAIKRIDGIDYVAAFVVRSGRRMLALQSMWKRGRPPSLRP